jgi:hypothetical protein
MPTYLIVSDSQSFSGLNQEDYKSVTHESKGRNNRTVVKLLFQTTQLFSVQLVRLYHILAHLAT